MRRARLSPEFTLAAACCRPAGEARNAAVRAAAGGVAWPRFAQVAARHRIEGLAHAALASAGVTPDAVVAEALRQEAGAIAVAGLEMAAETGRLQGLFDRAGIDNLVLKGATLDVLAWGRIGLKRSWDIDLLVTAADAARARALLEGEGYALESPADGAAGAFEAWVALAKEAMFRHPGRGCAVELHWRPADVATLLPGLSARSPSQDAPLSPTFALRTFADDELFAHLCVHGTSHAWSRLKWLADLGALLARRGDGERERLYRRAGDLGAGRCPAAALLLCECLLGLALPKGCAAAIRADAGSARLVAVALEAMTGGGGAEIAARPLAAERILLSHFLFDDGWRFRLSEWRRQWISVDDRMRLRLPRELSFVYGLLRGPLFVNRRLRRVFRRP
jgi:hypothetical protein